jgi:hypothetical protein
LSVPSGLGPLAQLRARNAMTVAVRAGSPTSKRTFDSMLATEIAKRIIGESATVTLKEGGEPSALVARGQGDIALTTSDETRPAGVVFSDEYARGYVVAIGTDAISLQAAVDSVLNVLVTTGEIERIAKAAGFAWEPP